MADDGGSRLVPVYNEPPIKRTCADANCIYHKIDKDRASANIVAIIVIDDTPGGPKVRHMDPDAERPPGTPPVYVIKQDLMNWLYQPRRPSDTKRRINRGN